MKKKQNNKVGTKAMCACGGIGTLNTIRTVQNESVQQPVLCIGANRMVGTNAMLMPVFIIARAKYECGVVCVRNNIRNGG
jgi:hypothetical protein